MLAMKIRLIFYRAIKAWTIIKPMHMHTHTHTHSLCYLKIHLLSSSQKCFRHRRLPRHSEAELSLSALVLGRMLAGESGRLLVCPLKGQDDMTFRA